MRPIVAPRPTDGFVHAHESATARHAGGDGPSVDDEAAVPVLDLGHELDVGDRIAVEPVRDQGVAGDDPLPHLDVPRRPARARRPTRRRSPSPRCRCRQAASAPRPSRSAAAAARTPAAANRRASGSSGRSTRSPSPRISSSGATAPIASSSEGSGERRPVASTTRSARISSPVSVTTPTTWGTPSRAGSPVNSPFTATPRRTVRFGVAAAVRAKAASTMGRRPVIASKRSSPSRKPPVTDSGAERDGVVAKHAVRVERLDGLRQLGLGDLAEARQEEVDHPELVDPLPFPRVPRLVARGRRRRRVALQHRHLMAIAGQQHGGRQTAHAAAHHKNARHGPVPLPFPRTTGGRYPGPPRHGVASRWSPAAGHVSRSRSTRRWPRFLDAAAATRLLNGAAADAPRCLIETRGGRAVVRSVWRARAR